MTRRQETVLGVVLPIMLLAVFEIIYRKKPYRVQKMDILSPPANAAEQTHGAQQSRLAIRTVAYALLGVGAMIFILGMLAPDGKTSVLGISLLIVFLGGLLRWISYKKIHSS